MTLLGALVVVLAVSSLMLLVLAALVVGRKVARDRQEGRSRDRRQRYARVLRERRPSHLTMLMDEVAADRSAQTDLLVELGRLREDLDAASRLAMRRAAHDFGLVDALVGGLADRDPVTRGRCGLLLARLGVPEAPAHLHGLLDDPDADVRLVACAGLALTESPDAATAMVGALRDRTLAPERLVERLGAPWAVVPLLVLLTREPPHAEGGVPVRAHIARALGLAGNRAAAPALVGLLCTGTTEERVSAARALGAVGGPESVGALAVALSDAEWPVRVQAARALGALGAGDRAELLGEMLADEAWWVRAAAAEALRDLGADGVRVLQAALDHPDRYARDRAREQLALVAIADTDARSPEAPVAEAIAA